MTISPARQVAFQILSDITEGRAYTNFALREAFRRVRLDDRDRALCSEIVYGTVQRERSIDALLQAHVDRKLKTLDKRVLTILRMAIYQFSYLSKVPAYAILNESVEICKRIQPRASGFINGVLRAFTRDSRSLSEKLETLAEKCMTWADRMGLVHSYPTWLVAIWEEAFGQEKTQQILEACNRPSGMGLRVNPLKATREAILRQLDAMGVPVEASLLSDVGIRVNRGLDVERCFEYTSGQVTVQDEGAMLIAPLLCVKPGERVLDLCAAPGTKTTHIAEMMKNDGTVVACDVHPHKRDLIKNACERLGISIVQTLTVDGRSFTGDDNSPLLYDAVLVDAPCSGFGVLAHRPDIRWHRSQKDVRALVELQVELLLNAVKLVRQGGVIVYSTCTLMPEENEQVVERVIREANGSVTWDNITDDLPDVLKEQIGDTDKGFLLTPDRFQTDGFYMARLKKQ